MSKLLLQEWLSTESVQNKDLSPQFGILMLNTSESLNSMTNKYHNEGWMELIEGVLQYFT